MPARPLLLAALAAPLCLAQSPSFQPLLNKSCLACHTGKAAKSGLDLAILPYRLDQRANRDRWVRIHDRIENGEMPPKSAPMAAADRATLLRDLASALRHADKADIAKNGRSPLRRLNRDEYEQNLRDLLQLPDLDIRDMLPEDREAWHFNKVSDTLDMSRVQLTAYLDATEAALRQAMATEATAPPVTKFRTNGYRLFPGLRSTGTLHSMFFLRGDKGINVARERPDPVTKEDELDPTVEMGLFRSPGWPYGAFPRGFAAPRAGHYRVRFEARAVLQQPGFTVTPARAAIPMTLRSRRPTNHDIAEDVKSVGGILEIQPGVHTYETTVLLEKGQTVEYGLLGLAVPQVDALPGQSGSYRFPPFPPDGAPGVAFRWLEIEGPITGAWPPPSHKVLFDELGINPQPADAKQQARRLLTRFLTAAARSPIPPDAARKFEALVFSRLDRNEPFTEAMLSGYQAILCSGLFLYLNEPRTHYDIAERLSHFLTNTRPDATLRQHAAAGHLRDPKTLRTETARLIAAGSFERFVRAFTAYWLNLRHLRRDDPDIRLYPEYRLDEYLVDSMERETQAYITAMVRDNLPITALVQSDFAYINDRLARHYNLPPVTGSAIRRVTLPKDSPRGGLLTQGAILKITANGTSTSPVLRGAWIMDRIAGDPPPPPPPGVPAVEPDIRGAKTIREQLALHTKSEVCSSCHAKFDPAGLALENFDIMGAFRTRYRGIAEGERVTGIDHTGHDFSYTIASPIDASGAFADGRKFRDVHELKQLLAARPRQLARNLLDQLIIYATGTPARFADRAEIEKMLDTCAPSGYRTADLVHALTQSQIFLGESQ